MRAEIHNETDLTWMLMELEPMPTLTTNDVHYQYILGISGEQLLGAEYYGSYSGVDVLLLYSTANDGQVYRVGDFCFYWKGPITLFAHKDGEIFELKEAYKLGYIGDADLSVILQYHARFFQKEFAAWIEMMRRINPDIRPAETTSLIPSESTSGAITYAGTDLSWLYEPADPPLPLSEFSEEECAQIRAAYLDRYGSPFPYSLDPTAPQAWSFGTYQDCVTVWYPRWTTVSGYRGEPLYVGTEYFGYISAFVYHEGKIYTLREAYYVENLISDEDLGEIRAYYREMMRKRLDS